MPQAELTDAGRVDQVAAAGKMEQSRGGGGMGALAGHRGEVADTGVDTWQQGIHQRRLAHPGLPDEDAHVTVQRAAQFVHRQAIEGRHLDQRVTQGAVDIQQRIDAFGIALVDQVGLVQQQQRLDAGMFGGDQVTVDQVGVRFGTRGEDDDDAVDVGRHRLEQPAHVRAAQLGAARQLRDDHADALVAGAPDHLVASHQCRQVGAQVTAGNLAVGGLDLYLNPEMSDHLAGLLRSQVAALQLFHGTRLATGRPGRAFFLDLFDAPALPAGQVAFGHDASA